MTRHATDPATKAYATRRIAEVKSQRVIIRCLNRYIAQEIYGLLTKEGHAPDTSDLRLSRQAHGLTLTDVAEHFNVWEMTISTLERGQSRNDKLEHHYQQWLNQKL